MAGVPSSLRMVELGPSAKLVPMSTQGSALLVGRRWSERGLWVRDGAIWLVGERQSHPVGVVPRDEIQASTGV